MDSFTLETIDDVVFKNNSEFKDFIGQFQIHCKKLLCIVNNNKLKFYSRKDEIPKNIKLLEIKNNTIDEYYFQDLDTQDIYCLFSKNAACIFYPPLNEKPEKPKKPILISYAKDSKMVFIYHEDKKYEIPWSNKNIEMKEIIIM